MNRRLGRHESLAESVRKDIIERTDGIPLFVEEMTKAVLEAETQRAAEHANGAISPPVPAVPASLHAPLLERLDRLGPAKQLAQIGAAIGREFPHALLAAVARKLEAQLNVALDRLLAAGLLFRQGDGQCAVHGRISIEISSSRPTSGVRWRCPARRPPPLALTMRKSVTVSCTPLPRGRFGAGSPKCGLSTSPSAMSQAQRSGWPLSRTARNFRQHVEPNRPR